MENEKLTPEQIISMAKELKNQGKSEEEQAETIKNFAQSNMNPAQNKLMEKLMGNPDKLKKLLSSEAAQNLLNKLK